MGNKLYVGNLPYGMGDAELRTLFEEEGRKVVDVRLISDRVTGQARGFGFVEMATEADALATELVDEADEHDSVENGNAGEGDETDSGRNRERHAAHPEGKDSASDRKRHTNEDECRLSQRAEAQE